MYLTLTSHFSLDEPFFNAQQLNLTIDYVPENTALDWHCVLPLETYELVKIRLKEEDNFYHKLGFFKKLGLKHFKCKQNKK